MHQLKRPAPLLAHGELNEFNSSGQIVYDAELPPTLDSNRTYRAPRGALPSTPPALREVNSGSVSTVYASWNGAATATSGQPSAAVCEVTALSASGRILAGPGAIGAGGSA